MKHAPLILFALFTLFSAGCSMGNKVVVRSLRSVHDVYKNLKVQSKDKDPMTDINRLLEAAHKGDREVRAESLWVLAKLRVRAAQETFVELAVADTDFNVRVMALYGIRTTKPRSEHATNAILQGLGDVNPHVVIEATRAAGIYQGDVFLVTLLKNLNTKNRWIKMATIEALAEYTDKRANEALTVLAEEEDDLAVKETIHRVLYDRELPTVEEPTDERKRDPTTSDPTGIDTDTKDPGATSPIVDESE